MNFGELLFLFVLALLVFGPRKLPEIARMVGKTMAELRRASNEFRFSLEEEIRNAELEEQARKSDVTFTPTPAVPAIAPPALAAAAESPDLPASLPSASASEADAAAAARSEPGAVADSNANLPAHPVASVPGTVPAAPEPWPSPEAED